MTLYKSGIIIQFYKGSHGDLITLVKILYVLKIMSSFIYVHMSLNIPVPWISTKTF